MNLENILESTQRIRFLIYFFIISGVLLYRAYIQDYTGMALCIALLPINLYAIVNAPE